MSCIVSSGSDSQILQVHVALLHVTRSCSEVSPVQSCRTLVNCWKDGVTGAVTLTEYAVSAEKYVAFGLVLH